MNNADMPAMPQSVSVAEGSGGDIHFSHSSEEKEWSGLSKREMFAMHAMQGQLPMMPIHEERDRKVIAESCVAMADALLAQLEDKS